MPSNIDPARSRSQRVNRQLPWLLAPSLLIAATGCKPVETRFEIQAYHEGAPARKLTERFDTGFFSRNEHRDATLVFEVYDANPGADQPPTDGSPMPPVTQIVTIQIFWEPRPGTTHVESTQTNATISYCLLCGPDSIRYSGAGFVYLSKIAPDRLEGRIESSALKVAQVVGSPRDLFGRCRIVGEFAATEDKRQVVAKTVQIRRLFGAPGLHQTPQPAMDVPLDD